MTLLELHKPKGEATGLALDRGIEHLDRVRIVRVREQGAFLVQHQPGRLHLLASRDLLDPMQRASLVPAPTAAAWSTITYEPPGLSSLLTARLKWAAISPITLLGRCR